jgi:hypothetical protein
MATIFQTQTKFAAGKYPREWNTATTPRAKV